MRPLSFEHDEAVDGLCRQVDEFVTAASALDDLGLLGASRCHGWSRLEVVTHVRMGLQELALGISAVTEDGADHDAATYWAAHPDDRDDDPVAHILWLRRVAGAYRCPTAAVAHLQDVANGVVRAVKAMPESTVDFQGKRLLSGDFLGTWVVELAVHQLDLDVVPGRPSGLAWTRLTLEAIADAVLPADLDDRTAVLAGLGREPCPPSFELPRPFPVSL